MNIIPIDAMLQEETHNLISLKTIIFRLLTAKQKLSLKILKKYSLNK
jgi:hypothetical protein